MRSIQQLREARLPKTIVVSFLFVVLYVLLDKVSFIHDLQHTEISPWGPNIALIVAAVMFFGPRVAPLAILAPGVSEIVLRGAMSHGLAVIGSMVCIGFTYASAGIVLRHLQRNYAHPTIGWFAILCVVISVAALLDALLYSAVLTLSGDLSVGSYLTAVRIDWVGDMNGIIILLPLVLILRAGEPGKLSEMRANIALLALQAAALTCIFWFTFRSAWGFSGTENQPAFYLLFLPIVWIALRWGAGVTAVALAVLQLGIVTMVAKYNTPESFLAIQVLMVLLAGTGLFMGISVSENARFGALMRSKDDELSHLNARMAVSEMNSALGHELNNPLAALVNYLRSAGLMLDLPELDRASLRSAFDKAQAEAGRSVAVVRKLREFFQSGMVRRQALDPKRLAADALAATQLKFRNAGITGILEAPVDMPLLVADSLQLSMVLQNLLTNAYDAVHDSGLRRGRVAIIVTPGADDVTFRVEDSGPGIAELLRDNLFRPVSSTKPEGMGLGLAICRSLVEANDGHIWLARSGVEGTCIAFSIPLGLQPVNEVES
ncbi:MAG: ATP-binding protein [Gammaproteobacteria bacterium]